MKLLIAILIALAIPLTAHACTAFYQSERISGLNKICYYSHLGSDVAYTFKSYEVCPVTIDVAH